MKQIDKLYNFIKDPRNFGIRKNTRVYRCICDLACYGVTQTGYSDRNSKYIETWKVVNVLNYIGIACRYGNIAPRGGACGERVFLTGKVKSDCLANHQKFVGTFLQEHTKKYSWDATNEFKKSLQN